MRISNCPGCLKIGCRTYCDKCLRSLFGNKKVKHILPFTRNEFDDFLKEHCGKLSISGSRIKHTLYLDKNKLKLSEKNGQYILKPIPYERIDDKENIPANEHLTMQIAKQVYKINVAANGIIFFSDDEMAYITKRFDIDISGNNLLQEDFAQIAERTEEKDRKYYKTDFSYEMIAELMKSYVRAYPVEIERFFKVILFNNLIFNNNAHLKKFSLYRNNIYGDYLLTPFYDLIHTSLHFPSQTSPALVLCTDGFQTGGSEDDPFYSKSDYLEFASRIGIKKNRIERIIKDMLSNSSQVEELVRNSYLSKELQNTYLSNYKNNLNKMSK